jgi:3D (Asp-Asp-Asp) domain-containing protein
MIRGYMLLGVCSMSIGTNYSSVKAEVVPINSFVASKNQANPIVENAKSEEYIESAKKYTEVPSKAVEEAFRKTKEIENKSTKSQEDEKSKGTPIKAELTAYCDDPRCSDQWGSKTAMQTRTRMGVIAAPKNIPLGSKMYIPELANYKSDGMFDVEDRGGAIKIKNDGTYVIDVWVPTYEEAVKFGRKKTTIYLVN